MKASIAKQKVKRILSQDSEPTKKSGTNLWNILFMDPRIKLIVIFNLLWSEFVETNERRFDLLLQILITNGLSVT